MSYSWTREGLEADLEGYVDPRVKRNEKIAYLVCDDLKKDNPELSFAPYLGQETFSFYIAATLSRVEVEGKQVIVNIREEFDVNLPAYTDLPESDVIAAIYAAIDIEKVKAIPAEAKAKAKAGLASLEATEIAAQDIKVQMAVNGCRRERINYNAYWQEPFISAKSGWQWVFDYKGFRVSISDVSEIEAAKKKVDIFIRWLDGASVEEVGEAVIKSYINQEGNNVSSWQEIKKGQIAKEKLINSLFERKNQLESKPKTRKNLEEIKNIESQISSLMR
jgi:hypothetical protein